MSGDELDDILATLGQQGCLFVFTFEIEAGSDGGRGYVIEVGDRGELFLSATSVRSESARHPQTVRNDANERVF